jgi:hypothetical protein
MKCGSLKEHCGSFVGLFLLLCSFIAFHRTSHAPIRCRGVMGKDFFKKFSLPAGSQDPGQVVPVSRRPHLLRSG